MSIQYIQSCTEYLYEAFREIDFDHAVDDILSYLTKHVGKIYKWQGTETIKKDNKVLIGLRYSIEDGTTFRFNWLKNADSVEIYSIDFWDSGEQFPVITLELNGDSIVKYLPALVELINNPLVSLNLEDYLSESLMLEYRTKGAKGKVKKGGSLYKASLETPSSEEDISPQIKNGENQLSKIKYADPDVVYDDLKHYVDMVLNGIQPALVITGGAGLGKTNTVLEQIRSWNLKEIDPTINESEGDWLYIKGTSTAWGLYYTLYKYRNKVIVFDDCDKVFLRDDADSILKAALDSYDTRRIFWVSEKTRKQSSAATQEEGSDDNVPSAFDFTGGIIFITNLPQSKMSEANLSRSFRVDLNFMAKDIIRIMRTMLKKAWPEFSDEIKEDAMNAIEEYYAKYGEDKIDLNLRSLLKAIRIRSMGIPRWKEMIGEQCAKIKN